VCECVPVLMGSGKRQEQKQQQVLPETAGKEHKKRLHWRPKKSDTIEKTKFKRIKTKKDSISSSNETESKMNENNENLENGNIESKSNNKKRKEEEKSGKDVVLEKTTAAQQLGYFLHQYQSANGIQLSALELESFKGPPSLYICMNI
jgi:hypothetical protein